MNASSANSINLLPSLLTDYYSHGISGHVVYTPLSKISILRKAFMIDVEPICAIIEPLVSHQNFSLLGYYIHTPKIRQQRTTREARQSERRKTYQNRESSAAGRHSELFCLSHWCFWSFLTFSESIRCCFFFSLSPLSFSLPVALASIAPRDRSRSITPLRILSVIYTRDCYTHTHTYSGYYCGRS